MMNNYIQNTLYTSLIERHNKLKMRIAICYKNKIEEIFKNCGRLPLSIKNTFHKQYHQFYKNGVVTIDQQ